MNIKDREIILTAEGRAQLEEELHYLENEKREEVGERIRVAREFGDISENSEFDDAKEEQARLETRILEIEAILANAVISDLPKRNTKIMVGNIVTLTSEDGSERIVQVVGSSEAKPAEGKISNESPLGAAMLGKKKGEIVSFTTPSGKTNTYTVTKITR